MLVLDGAMGTMLHAKGIPSGACPEYQNVLKPQIVIDIHKAFIDSGADVIQTNTFGANRIKLSKFGLEDRVSEINKHAMLCAKKARDSSTQIALSIGPTGEILEPWGTLAFDEAVDIFKEQVRAAVPEDPDFIIIETMAQLSEARAALLAVKSLANIPVMTTMVFDKNSHTIFGTPPEAAAITLDAMGSNGVGVNCVGDFNTLNKIISRMSQAIGKTIIAQPNAGNPKFLKGKTVFPLTPDDFSQECLKLLGSGIRALGGCCGTTPDHIKSLVGVVKALKTGEPIKDPKKPANAIASSFETICLKANHASPFIGKVNTNTFGKISPRDGSGLIKGAKTQRDNGAKVVCVNLDTLAQVKPAFVKDIILSLQKNIRNCLCFEGGCPEYLELALRHYHGKALVKLPQKNSPLINEAKTIVGKYGGLLFEEN